MHCFWCSIAKGELELKEHQSARWLEKGEWESVDWLPADVEVVNTFKSDESKKYISND